MNADIPSHGIWGGRGLILGKSAVALSCALPKAWHEHENNSYKLLGKLMREALGFDGMQKVPSLSRAFERYRQNLHTCSEFPIDNPKLFLQK